VAGQFEVGQRVELKPKTAPEKIVLEIARQTAWRNPAPGAHTIVSRVTDVDGQVQATPDQMPQQPSRWENYAQFPRTVMIA
jgi:hypothetical protein